MKQNYKIFHRYDDMIDKKYNDKTLQLELYEGIKIGSITRKTYSYGRVKIVKNNSYDFYL
jgi:hypothetical protein